MQGMFISSSVYLKKIKSCVTEQNHSGCSHKSPGLQKQQFRIVSIATHVARNEI